MENNKARIAEQAKIFKALGHPSRLLMVDALRDGEQCVYVLKDLVGADMSTVSKHLSVLKEAGIVEVEKRGTHMFYRLSFPCLHQFLSCTQNFLDNQLAEKKGIVKLK